MPKKSYFKHDGTFTKSDIAEKLFSEIGVSKKYSAEVTDFCFEVVKKKLILNNNVKISGFGHFILRDKNEKIGRDPTTGKKITIPSRRVLTFRESASLREKVQDLN